MRVISRKTLREFWEIHATAQAGLSLWYQRITEGDFQTFNELRQVFPSADLVGNLTVFNISGNNFRLITYIDYAYQLIFIRAVLTHAEYDKEKWKNDDWFKNS
ncbi:type II toxin-antitoxin system HigB family toxin [Kovacikia minuta CCNUW1]|uniref:type II toxin-antitoxin system HigB family toxin n=1 Tax=Kovacikia minuta TaxID=2931930 RepID=UPI001CCDAFC2|nr:type II toxin-antitoxin system HigB family toxin [Kovacikia minuta]UBF28514.1 type II toxin-antitoxin system HigB family toxin [Kovacikia minuta CCNUW1]